MSITNFKKKKIMKEKFKSKTDFSKAGKRKGMQAHLFYLLFLFPFKIK